MGKNFTKWVQKSADVPKNEEELISILWANRQFSPIHRLDYGDHGLKQVMATIKNVLKRHGKIALYADYDVDGTMSCVSWIWFFKAIGYENYVYYIPCRFKEGYGLNMEAIRYLVEDEKCDLVVTMDTGITANQEAQYCKERGVDFICTDHHLIQKEKMPDCLILNPKMHPDLNYQELCGCGITFVLLRKLAKGIHVKAELWTDLLALAGMATICDIVPLNPVNHQLAKKGVDALLKSQRQVLMRLCQAAKIDENVDEKDIGFRIGPRINAVGRLGHASEVIKAFLSDDPEPLIKYMDICNEERKSIQNDILEEGMAKAAEFDNEPILFLGGDWHPGVVGIAASRIAEHYWKPTWLFQRNQESCKGSARSIPGFNVTECMQEGKSLFTKFGGHSAAAGFSFPGKNEKEIRAVLNSYAREILQKSPDIWQSKISYDCHLPTSLSSLGVAQKLAGLKPFGHGFEEPLFLLKESINSISYYNSKKTGEKAHTAISIGLPESSRKILFFNEVLQDFRQGQKVEILASIGKNRFRGRDSVSLFGKDIRI